MGTKKAAVKKKRAKEIYKKRGDEKVVSKGYKT